MELLWSWAGVHSLPHILNGSLLEVWEDVGAGVKRNSDRRVSEGLLAVQRAMEAASRLDYQIRPFFESLRLVDSVGVANPVIASSLEAVRKSVKDNRAAYMESISKTVAGSLTPTTLEFLSSTLDLINRKLGHSGFASVQVRAVEDLLNRIPSSAISYDVVKAFASQMDIASGAMVRHILERAEAGDLLDGDAGIAGAPPDTLTGESSVSRDDASSVFLWQTWEW
ncbi:MAG: hypothetical protein M3305_17885 [Actinomycetota bacterium]|nr:hypothetical protein [Actinomycetota bacterium]